MISEALIESGSINTEKKLLKMQNNLIRLFQQNLTIDVLISSYKPKWLKKNSSSHFSHDNNLVENMENAFEDARYLCEQHYISAPELEIVTRCDITTFPYVPSHLYLIFFELFKNSLRATCEKFENTECLPPIVVTVDREDKNITVNISDDGGGMTDEQLIKAKLFFSTSAVLNNMSLYQGAHSSPLAGYGFGIGMVQIYTEYFGGTINIQTSEGHGTSVKLNLPNETSTALENLKCYD